MLASFLLPTRGNPNDLLKNLKSLIIKSSENEDWEVLIAMDDDDEESISIISQIDELFKPHDFCNYVVMIMERQGYANLQNYYNKLANISHGELLVLWNDDVVMNSPNWDYLLRNDILRWPDRMCFFPIETNQFSWMEGKFTPMSGFPIVRREWLKILGHYTQDFRNDTYIWNAALGYWEPCRVCITHNNVENIENQNGWKIGSAKKPMDGDEFMSQVINDNYKIQKHMWELNYGNDKPFVYNNVFFLTNDRLLNFKV